MRFLLVIVILTSCNKSMDDPKYPTLEASALFNGLEWKADSWTIDDPNNPESLAISVVRYDENMFQQESITFQAVPKEPGMHVINARPDIPSSSLNLWAAHGDVPLAFYQVVSGEESYINIESISIENKEVRGTFRATYALSMLYDDQATVDDTIRVTRGVFRSAIRE